MQNVCRLGLRLMQRWRRTQRSLVQKCEECLQRPLSSLSTESQTCLSMRNTSKLSSGNESQGLRDNSQGFEHMLERVLLETSELPLHLKCIRIGLRQIMGHCDS